MVEPITQYFCLLSFQWFQLLFFVLVWWFVFLVLCCGFFYKEPFTSISRSGIYYLLWFQCNPPAPHLLKDGRAKKKKEISSATLQCYTDYLNTIKINYYFFQWSQKYIILHFLGVQRNVSLLQMKRSGIFTQPRKCYMNNQKHTFWKKQGIMSSLYVAICP